MIRIAIIIGSTRPGRACPSVAQWVHGIASTRTDAHYDILDIADYNLPHLDESTPAAMGPNYTHEHTQKWSADIAYYDGYIIVTPEYNHSIPGALKDAIDYLYTEWHNKAIGFVGYGLIGGTRAVEHLRGIAGELQLADVRAQVALSIFTDFDNRTDPNPGLHHASTLTTMLDQLTQWSHAMQALRLGQLDTPALSTT
jgi:NAD(P)H-dependent FMN reductase